MKAWSYPYPTHTTNVLDDIPVVYVDEGDGPETLIMIHGLGSNLKGFWKNIQGLSDTYRCIALDLPGYGKSDWGDHRYGMRFYARAIHSFLASLAIDEATLVGHSMGGQIALTAALHDSSRIKQLVLLAPAGFETFNPEHHRWFNQIYNADLLQLLSTRQIKQNFYLNFVDFPEDAYFMIDDRLQMREDKEAFRHFCRLQVACIAAMLQEPVFAHLHKIDLPTLVLFGEEDQLIPNRFVHPFLSPRKVASQGMLRMPQAELEMLSPCGHFPQWECAEEVNQAILRFLG